jgi:hypothetical protein
MQDTQAKFSDLQDRLCIAIKDLRVAIEPLQYEEIVRKYLSLCDDAVRTMEEKRLLIDEFYIYLALFNAISERFMNMLAALAGCSSRREGHKRHSYSCETK